MIFVYLCAGLGFHSNDLRGVLGTVPAPGVSNPSQGTPFLTKVTSEEIGVRSDAVPLTTLTAAIFREKFASFLTYDADNGVDDAGPPALLQGLELSAQVRPYDWLELNGDLDFTRSRDDTAEHLQPVQYRRRGVAIRPRIPGRADRRAAVWRHLSSAGAAVGARHRNGIVLR